MNTLPHNVVPIRIATPHACELAIDDIRVEDRHRSDLGDIAALAASIASIGLIHPPVVTPDHRLIAGERRLAALRSLGRESVQVTVIHTLADAADRLVAERDENTCRKEMTASEMVALGRKLEALERPKAKQRQGNRRDLTSGSVEPEVENRSTDQVVAENLGVSQSTYKRNKTVVKAMEDPDPAVADVAREQLCKLDAGETSSSAADAAVRRAREGKKIAVDPNDPLIDADVEPEVIPGLPTKVHGPRPNHLKVLSRVVVNLSGMVIALEDIEAINDTVNAEEALRISKDLSTSIRALNRINKLLKERTK